MALLDLLGRRWALRVLWELRGDAVTFRELRARCDSMSPSVLNDRLAELREAGLVDHVAPGGYCLTPHSRELLTALTPLDRWAKRWARREGDAPLSLRG